MQNVLALPAFASNRGHRGPIEPTVRITRRGDKLEFVVYGVAAKKAGFKKGDYGSIFIDDNNDVYIGTTSVTGLGRKFGKYGKDTVVLHIPYIPGNPAILDDKESHTLTEKELSFTKTPGAICLGRKKPVPEKNVPRAPGDIGLIIIVTD